jgi:hypothetical protein
VRRLRQPLKLLPLRVLIFALIVVAGMGRSTAVPAGRMTSCDTAALVETLGSTFTLSSRFAPIGGVNLATGWFRLQAIDVQSVPSLASSFIRSYASGDTRTTMFGPGWTSSAQVRLRAANAKDLLVTFSDGATERFDGAYAAGRGTGTSRPYRVIEHDADGDWVLRDNGRLWTFDTLGNLIRVDDPTGDWAELRYEGETVRSTVGPDGPGLVFEIGPGGRLTKVSSATDPTAIARYEFDAIGRLARVVPAIGPARRYTYLGQTQQVSAIADDAGTVLLRLDYDETGRVIRDADAAGVVDGEAVTFAYEMLPDGGSRTTVTYPVSTIEPGWHPIQVETEDRQARTRSLELRPTSWAVLLGRYDWDNVNRRIALNPRACPPLDAPRPTTPGDVAAR